MAVGGALAAADRCMAAARLVEATGGVFLGGGGGGEECLAAERQ